MTQVREDRKAQGGNRAINRAYQAIPGGKKALGLTEPSFRSRRKRIEGGFVRLSKKRWQSVTCHTCVGVGLPYKGYESDSEREVRCAAEGAITLAIQVIQGASGRRRPKRERGGEMLRLVQVRETVPRRGIISREATADDASAGYVGR